MAAHSGSDTLRLHRVGPSPCASALALDTRHRPVCGRSVRCPGWTAVHKFRLSRRPLESMLCRQDASWQITAHLPADMHGERLIMPTSSEGS